MTGKRRIYAEIGVPEYWRFDRSGGHYYGAPLAGERLVDGIYQPVPLSGEPDGILKGYSPALRLSLCWGKTRCSGSTIPRAVNTCATLRRSRPALTPSRLLGRGPRPGYGICRKNWNEGIGKAEGTNGAGHILHALIIAPADGRRPSFPQACVPTPLMFAIASHLTVGHSSTLRFTPREWGHRSAAGRHGPVVGRIPKASGEDTGTCCRLPQKKREQPSPVTIGACLCHQERGFIKCRPSCGIVLRPGRDQDDGSINATLGKPELGHRACCGTLSLISRPEDGMNKTELKEDWLAGNAVVAFLGALMLAQTWRLQGGAHELPFNLTLPAFPDPVSFTIAAFLFLSSFALALASIIPIRRLRHWGDSPGPTFLAGPESVYLDRFPPKLADHSL